MKSSNSFLCLILGYLNSASDFFPIDVSYLYSKYESGRYFRCEFCPSVHKTYDYCQNLSFVVPERKKKQYSVFNSKYSQNEQQNGYESHTEYNIDHNFKHLLGLSGTKFLLSNRICFRCYETNYIDFSKVSSVRIHPEANQSKFKEYSTVRSLKFLTEVNTSKFNESSTGKSVSFLPELNKGKVHKSSQVRPVKLCPEVNKRVSYRNPQKLN